MGEVVSILLAFIFALLSALHFAWAVGVKWGFDASLPTNEQGEKVLNPKTIDCIIVGLGLGFFSVFYLSKYYIIQLTLNDAVDSIASWLIPIIFFLRFIGDFRYFGIFKKLKTTAFGKLDSRFIMPLCLGLSLLGFLLIALD